MNEVIHTDMGKEHEELMESESLLTYGVNKLSWWAGGPIHLGSLTHCVGLSLHLPLQPPFLALINTHTQGHNKQWLKVKLHCQMFNTEVLYRKEEEKRKS